MIPTGRKLDRRACVDCVTCHVFKPLPDTEKLVGYGHPQVGCSRNHFVCSAYRQQADSSSIHGCAHSCAWISPLCVGLRPRTTGRSNVSLFCFKTRIGSKRRPAVGVFGGVRNPAPNKLDAHREKARNENADQFCSPYFFILLYNVTRLTPNSLAVFVRLKLFLNNVCSMISFSFNAIWLPSVRSSSSRGILTSFS